MDKETLSNPRLFVEAWIKKNELEPRPDGSLVKGKSIEDVGLSMNLDYVDIYNTVSKKNKPRYPLGKRILVDALKEFVMNAREEIMQRAVKRIALDTEDLRPLEEYCRRLFLKDDVKFEVHCLAHFIWQVKRKANNLKVWDHLCPVLKGPQGYGKSTALKFLFQPLADYVFEVSGRDLSDLTRSGVRLSNSLIAFMDELEGLQKADVNQVKKVITADTIPVRQFQTQSIPDLPQLATFIGATNKSVNELFYDPTGMRRFVELKLPSDKKIEVDSILDNLDALKIWKAIDENKKNGYIPEIKEELLKAQADLTPPDTIETFLREHYLVESHTLADILDQELDTDENRELFQLSIDFIYESFKKWCDQAGVKCNTKIWLGRKLSNNGFESVRRRNKLTGTKSTYYIIPNIAIKCLKLTDKKIENKMGDVVPFDPTKGKELK